MQEVLLQGHQDPNDCLAYGILETTTKFLNTLVAFISYFYRNEVTILLCISNFEDISKLYLLNIGLFADH